MTTANTTRLGRVLAPLLERPVLAIDRWLMRTHPADPTVCGVVRDGSVCGQPAVRVIGSGSVGICAGHEPEIAECAEYVESILRGQS